MSTSSVRSSITRPAPAALLAGMLDQRARAAARRTGAGADELAEDAARHLLHPAAAAARRAGADGRVGLGAVAAAAAALDGDAERHLALGSRRDLGELDLDPRRDVGSARAAHAAADAEEVVAEERGEEIRQAAEVEGARLKAAAAQARMAEPVVQLAPLGVREHLVRLDDLAEAMLRIGCLRDVRMQLAGEPAERALDVVGSRVARDAEQLVVVALGAQLSSYTSSTKRESSCAAPRTERIALS